jgi:hypothetical protein
MPPKVRKLLVPTSIDVGLQSLWLYLVSSSHACLPGILDAGLQSLSLTVSAFAVQLLLRNK